MNASCGISTLPTCFMRFFPSFCFPEAFLTGHVAAIAFGQNVLLVSLNSFPGNNFASNSSLDGHFKLLPRNNILQLQRQSPAPGRRIAAVNNDGQGIDQIPVQEDIQLHGIGLLVSVQLIVQGRIAFGAGFQLVKEIKIISERGIL